MSRRPPLRIVIASDSREPSGMGEHMLTLGRALKRCVDVTIALSAGQESLLTRAANLGLAVKSFGDEDDFSRWLSRSGANLLHVHAGIGWEGHGLAHAGRCSGLPVVRTEHLPYLLTDDDQKNEFVREIEGIDGMIVVSQASMDSFEAQGLAPA